MADPHGQEGHRCCATPISQPFQYKDLTMARTKEERHSLIHQDAMAEFEKIQTALRDERLQCLQDRRFYSISGAQWEGPLGVQFENKPRFEVNKIHLAVIRIINEYRNNRISVKLSPQHRDVLHKHPPTG